MLSMTFGLPLLFLMWAKVILNDCNIMFFSMEFISSFEWFVIFYFFFLRIMWTILLSTLQLFAYFVSSDPRFNM